MFILYPPITHQERNNINLVVNDKIALQLPYTVKAGFLLETCRSTIHAWFSYRYYLCWVVIQVGSIQFTRLIIISRPTILLGSHQGTIYAQFSTRYHSCASTCRYHSCGVLSAGHFKKLCMKQQMKLRHTEVHVCCCKTDKNARNAIKRNIENVLSTDKITCLIG